MRHGPPWPLPVNAPKIGFHRIQRKTGRTRRSDLLSPPVLTQRAPRSGYPAAAIQRFARQVRCYQHLRKPCRMLFPPEAPGPAGPKHRDKRERNNAQVDCRRLCSDLGVISTGFATRIPPSARPTGRSSPRSMRRRYAHGEWCLRENSRPPCREQVRPRAHLLKPRTRLDAGIDIQPWTFGPASKTLARCRVIGTFRISGKISDLSPQSDPKRASLRPNSPIAIYEYTP